MHRIGEVRTRGRWGQATAEKFGFPLWRLGQARRVLGSHGARAKGDGQQKGYEESYRGSVVDINLLKKVRIEIAVNDDFVQLTIDAISSASHSGKIGDGKIFVTSLEQCVRIRTGEEGEPAVG